MSVCSLFRFRFSAGNVFEAGGIDNQNFIDCMFDEVINSPVKWKLFFQLATQQEVMDIMMQENLSDKFVAYQTTLFNYFVVHEFEDLHVSILHFSSVYKGFAMSYVFAPELFDKKALFRFKSYLKNEA